MSLEMDITEIKKLLKEEFGRGATLMVAPRLPQTSRAGTQTMPITKPETEPATEPDTKQERPRHPMQPDPGVTPKPKALVNESLVRTNAVEAFFKRRGMNVPDVFGLPNRVAEAGEHAVHPDKVDWIEKGDEEIDQLLPGLPEEQRQYLATVATETYDALVKRIYDYTGIPLVKESLPELASLLMKTLQKTIGWESKNKARLEDLALDLVLSVPEYKVAEEMYVADKVKFDAKLDTPDLTRLLQPPQQEETPEEGLTTEEKINLEMVELFQNTSDADIRRKFANLMITGGTIQKLYLYNMVADRLNSIDPHLVNCYGILSSTVQLGYWVLPFEVEQGATGGTGEEAMGSEEVIPEGEVYVIKARGKTFPFLVHEISKGISEYLLLTKDLESAYKKDTLEDETKDMISGPGIYRAIVAYIPSGEQELIPMVQKKLIAMGPAEIRDVLGKTQNGKNIMNNLISTSREELSKYREDEKTYKESQ
jgi:hypothetical protein